MKKSRILLPIAMLALTIGLVGCGPKGGEQGKSDNPTSQKEGQQEKIVIEASTKTLILGETVQLAAKVGDKALEGVTWESDKPEIASVDAKGLVTSKAVGSAKITAKKDGYKDGTVSIKVELEKITVSAEGDKKSILAGETVKLTASQQGVKWESSDPSVATVNEQGVVTGVKFGEAVITASKEGFDPGKITINVVRPEVSLKIDLTTGAYHHSADGWWELPSSGGMGFSMQTVAGWNPIAQQTSWGQQSEDPVETYIGGFGEGDKETVKFSSSKAVKAEIVLDIGNSSEVALGSVMSVKLNDKAIDLSEVTLEAHAGDWGNTLTFGELSLGELDIVSGENTLEFGFLAATNIFLNEVHLYAGDATVTLVPPALKEQIVISANETEVIEEQTIQLTASVADVTWVSLDEQVATVDQTGKVTGVKMGKVNIRALKEGMYSVQVEILVNPKPVAGQILLEAEAAEELKDVQPGSFNQGEPMIMQDGGMMGGNEVHSGGAYVTMWGGDSLTLTFIFNAETAQTMVLSVVGSAPMSMGGEAAAFVFADSMAVKMNEVEVTPVEGAEFPAPEGYSSTMSEVVFGDVAVNAGENTLVVEITGSIPSLDVFKLSVKA